MEKKIIMDVTLVKTKNPITTWNQFNKEIRTSNRPLLKTLSEFQNPILVTGCQRSGTTMLAEIIGQSEGLTSYKFTPDSELDAALILSGYESIKAEGRYCFQTTYLNEKYYEYYEHEVGQKIIWLVRNPFSVVYSILYNWNNTPNRLFSSCGVNQLRGMDFIRYKLFGLNGISLLRQACWGYVGKTFQMFELRERYGQDSLIVVDYDDLVIRKNILLPALYNFLGLKYSPMYGKKIHNKSLAKVNKLTDKERRVITSICQPIYTKACGLLPEMSSYK
jgi:hypothetical protein